MSRGQKSKLFDLFKSDFKITFFHNPSFTESGDDYYYIVLDDMIRLRIKRVNSVAVIDSVCSITKSYVSPIYDKIISVIKNQTKVTVLISNMGDTFPLRQSCINHGLPLIEDETYITVPQVVYQKWKKQNEGDLSRYGFYIVSVSDVLPIEPNAPKAVNLTFPKNRVDVIPPSSLPIFDNKIMNQVVDILKNNIPEITIEESTKTSIRCYLPDNEEFSVEYIEGILYIKELLQNPETTMNLVKISTLLTVIELFVKVAREVYIVNIQNATLYRLCSAKGYEFVKEESKLPLNNLFKQAFSGYGTCKVVIKN